MDWELEAEAVTRLDRRDLAALVGHEFQNDCAREALEKRLKEGK